jgi:osmotically-inducible protein OsmY
MVSKEETVGDYLAEQMRDAIAREAHELGVVVTVIGSEVLLEGCVESDIQRQCVEGIARRVGSELNVTSRIEVVTLEGKVEKESLP